MPICTEGIAAFAADKPLGPYKYTLRDLRSNDVHIRVRYSGICHSDIHQVKAEWCIENIYPMVPGHEIIGEVIEIGSDVTRLKVGDLAGVGCFVNSCRSCQFCDANEEEHCSKAVMTYNARDFDGTVTYGGYGRNVVCNEHFAVRVPDSFSSADLPYVAPLLCAGITCWAPMKRWRADAPGKHIGVLGLGGLGHMAVKLGVAFGNKVTVISTSERKRKEAIEEFGASEFIISKDPVQMAAAKGTIDFLIDTVAAGHPMQPYMDLLAVGGIMCCIALPPTGNMIEVSPFSMIFENKTLVGSFVGGMKDTQDMINFCAEHKVLPKCEFIKLNDINDAYVRILANNVRYRFVIDMESSVLDHTKINDEGGINEKSLEA